MVAATEFQRNLRDRNEGVSDEDQMLFRVGLNLGDVIIEGDNLYGDGVNVAGRLKLQLNRGVSHFQESFMMRYAENLT
ncbi:MAG: hypothetical protein Ct9H300mP28_21840 [Pseudomonadota bacterium]|nr:MAG: hypothetical protein Ct9H300mP28_21840 [Pseudomonadota bacterium]